MFVTEPLELATGAAVWDVFANTLGENINAIIVQKLR